MKIRYDNPDNPNLKITAWVCKWHYVQIRNTHNNVEILEEVGIKVPERVLTNFLREYIISGGESKSPHSTEEILENEEYKEIRFRFFCRESKMYQIQSVEELALEEKVKNLYDDEKAISKIIESLAFKCDLKARTIDTSKAWDKFKILRDFSNRIIDINMQFCIIRDIEREQNERHVNG